MAMIGTSIIAIFLPVYRESFCRAVFLGRVGGDTSQILQYLFAESVFMVTSFWGS